MREKPGKGLETDCEPISCRNLPAKLKELFRCRARVAFKEPLPCHIVSGGRAQMGAGRPPSTEAWIVNVDPRPLKLFHELLREDVVRLRSFRDAAPQAAQVRAEVFRSERSQLRFSALCGDLALCLERTKGSTPSTDHHANQFRGASGDDIVAALLVCELTNLAPDSTTRLVLSGLVVELVSRSLRYV